jgi:hypothetical protein
MADRRDSAHRLEEEDRWSRLDAGRVDTCVLGLSRFDTGS